MSRKCECWFVFWIFNVCVCVRYLRLRVDCVGYACDEAVRLGGLTVLAQGLGSPWIIFT